MRLVAVYDNKDAPRVLWNLMKARLADKQAVNISHQKMPKWKEHLKFIKSHVNGDWYLIELTEPSEGIKLTKNPGPHELGITLFGPYAGWVYLNRRNEIGLMLFPDFRGWGFGTKAITEIMRKHKRKRYLANINPKNERSIKFFERLGFKLLQQTYELRR